MPCWPRAFSCFRQAGWTACWILLTHLRLGALFTAILVNVYYSRFFDLLAARGYHPSQIQMERGRDFVLRAEQKGLRNIKPPPFMRSAIRDFEIAHVHAYQLTFALMGFVAIVGAVVCWLMVRKADHELPTNIFTRRSRWIW